jgi:hypothetical protein
MPSQRPPKSSRNLTLGETADSEKSRGAGGGWVMKKV